MSDMRIEPEISGVLIILIGDFNPAIFTPAWFELNELLPKGTKDAADLQVAHQQITAFSIDWLRIEVTTGRFLVETQSAPYVRTRDLVARVFKEHLYHTPLRALGINRIVRFPTRNLEEFDRIGRTLAPVEPWGTWGQKLGLDGVHGGMTSLTMSQIKPEDKPDGGEINITVSPYDRIGAGQVGVHVGVNDHYDFSAAIEPRASHHLIELLEEHFEASLSRSNGIIDHIMSLATNHEA